MKKWTMFALLLMFALSIALPERGLSAESPRFEKASLKKDFVSNPPRHWYIFDFDFVNALSQPLEIISVNVFDMNRQKVEQDWAMGGRNWDPRLMTHALSGTHPLAQFISKPRGTPLEQATVSPVGDRIEIKVTNRIMSPGQAIRPSVYFLSSKNNYDSLTLQVAYKVNGKLQEVSRTFTVGMKEEEKPPSQPVSTPPPSAAVSREPRGTGKNLIVLVHGCCTDKNGLREWDELGGEIAKKIKKKEGWEIVVWDWSPSTPVPPIFDLENFLAYADFAFKHAFDESQKLAASIKRYSGYEYIHLIGHSAGSSVIDSSAKELANHYKIKGKEKPFIHLTFLDAYTPNEDSSDYGNIVNYPHYAEHYVDRGPLKYTDTCLRYAFNVDLREIIVEGSGGFGGHQKPRKFYRKSITSSIFKHGYPLSLEGGNSKYRELAKDYPKGQQCSLFGIQCIRTNCWKNSDSN